MELLLEPFSYAYMTRAMLVSAMVGGLMLKGWSLIGDALSHSVVPGVAGAYLLGLPFALGAFLAGGLAALAMLFLSERSGLKVDVVIGMIFTAFFGLGLFMVSVNPASVAVETIIFGNILAITPEDTVQLVLIGAVAGAFLLARWRDLLVVFFDERHAHPQMTTFFAVLSASVVAAMQTVGAFLVIAMVVTPGATAYLLVDRFGRLLALSVAIGTATCLAGAYLSYFLDGATGGIIVTLQFLAFIAAFLLAPRHGLLATRSLARSQAEPAGGAQGWTGRPSSCRSSSPSCRRRSSSPSSSRCRRRCCPVSSSSRAGP